MTVSEPYAAAGFPEIQRRQRSHPRKIFLDNEQELCKLACDLTTVYPLTVVHRMVEPGVPPNAGLFLSRDSMYL
jgi:hypothetical protein